MGLEGVSGGLMIIQAYSRDFQVSIRMSQGVSGDLWYLRLYVYSRMFYRRAIVCLHNQT